MGNNHSQMSGGVLSHNADIESQQSRSISADSSSSNTGNGTLPSIGTSSTTGKQLNHRTSLRERFFTSHSSSAHTSSSLMSTTPRQTAPSAGKNANSEKKPAPVTLASLEDPLNSVYGPMLLLLARNYKDLPVQKLPSIEPKKAATSPDSKESLFSMAAQELRAKAKETAKKQQQAQLPPSATNTSSMLQVIDVRQSLSAAPSTMASMVSLTGGLNGTDAAPEYNPKNVPDLINVAPPAPATRGAPSLAPGGLMDMVATNSVNNPTNNASREATATVPKILQDAIDLVLATEAESVIKLSSVVNSVASNVNIDSDNSEVRDKLAKMRVNDPEATNSNRGMVPIISIRHDSNDALAAGLASGVTDSTQVAALSVRHGNMPISISLSSAPLESIETKNVLPPKNIAGDLLLPGDARRLNVNEPNRLQPRPGSKIGNNAAANMSSSTVSHINLGTDFDSNTPKAAPLPQRPAKTMLKINSCATLYMDGTLNNADLKDVLKCMAIALWCTIRHNHDIRAFKSHDVFSEKLHPLSRDVTSQKLRRVPDVDDVYHFLYQTFKSTMLSAENAIASMIYIERMLSNTGVTLYSTNWRRVTIGSLILAAKVWDDQAIWNIDFCNYFSDVHVKDFNDLERWYMHALHYNVSIKRTVYAKYYFELRDLVDHSSRLAKMKPLAYNQALKIEATTPFSLGVLRRPMKDHPKPPGLPQPPAIPSLTAPNAAQPASLVPGLNIPLTIAPPQAPVKVLPARIQALVDTCKAVLERGERHGLRPTPATAQSLVNMKPGRLGKMRRAKSDFIVTGVTKTAMLM